MSFMLSPLRIKHIAPAIEKVEGNKEEKVEECIKSNVRFVKQKLLLMRVKIRVLVLH